MPYDMKVPIPVLTPVDTGKEDILNKPKIIEILSKNYENMEN